MAWSSVVTEPIVPEQVLARVGSDEDGAALLFLGIVRDHADGRAVRGMRYDAYREMAHSMLADIVVEASERLGTDRVAVVHRTGELAVGEVSVAIAVSSPHRAESYDASRYVIEQIKKRLPVWKKEHYADGGEAWVEGTVPPGSGAAPATLEDEANAESAGYEAGAGVVGELGEAGASGASGSAPEDEANAVSAGREAAAGADAEAEP